MNDYGVKQNGSETHFFFFYQAIKAYNTGIQSRKMHSDDFGDVHWPKS